MLGLGRGNIRVRLIIRVGLIIRISGLELVNDRLNVIDLVRLILNVEVIFRDEG